MRVEGGRGEMVVRWISGDRGVVGGGRRGGGVSWYVSRRVL